MRQIKKIVSMAAAAALLCLAFLGSGSLVVHAEEPVTYCVKYVAENNEWRFQVGSAWVDGGYHRELYYLKQDIKDGDLLVVEGNADTLHLELDVRLSNLTFNHGNGVVTAKGIDACYVLRDSQAAVNGDITNAYVYDNAVCTFNNNVDYLEVTGSYGVSANLSVGGTVAHVKGILDERVFYDIYNVSAGKLYVENGALKTDAQYYSTTPQENTAVAAAGTPETVEEPAAPAAETAAIGVPAASVSEDEYDDVPKTGESNLIFWLLGIASVSLVGSFCLRKSSR